MWDVKEMSPKENNMVVDNRSRDNGSRKEEKLQKWQKVKTEEAKKKY